jgi:hypothetical protein
MEKEETTDYYKAEESCQVCLVDGTAYTTTKERSLTKGKWIDLPKGKEVSHVERFTIKIKTKE